MRSNKASNVRRDNPTLEKIETRKQSKINKLIMSYYLILYRHERGKILEVIHDH